MCWMIARRTRHCPHGPPPKAHPSAPAPAHRWQASAPPATARCPTYTPRVKRSQMCNADRERYAHCTLRGPRFKAPRSGTEARQDKAKRAGPVVLLLRRAPMQPRRGTRADLLVLRELDDGREERVGQALHADDPVHGVQLADDVEPRLHAPTRITVPPLCRAGCLHARMQPRTSPTLRPRTTYSHESQHSPVTSAPDHRPAGASDARRLRRGARRHSRVPHAKWLKSVACKHLNMSTPRAAVSL